MILKQVVPKPKGTTLGVRGRVPMSPSVFMNHGFFQGSFMGP